MSARQELRLQRRSSHWPEMPFEADKNLVSPPLPPSSLGPDLPRSLWTRPSGTEGACGGWERRGRRKRGVTSTGASKGKGDVKVSGYWLLLVDE